jgi:hypothetical protein
MQTSNGGIVGWNRDFGEATIGISASKERVLWEEDIKCCSRFK